MSLISNGQAFVISARHGLMSQPLTSLYDTRVAEGLLRPDPEQRAVMERLEAVRATLDTPQPKGFLARFRRAEPEGKQGLYLWGGVGRGKVRRSQEEGHPFLVWF